MGTRKIAIVESHAVTREGLRTVLSSELEFSVYTAKNYSALMQHTWGNMPEVIILDNLMAVADNNRVIWDIKQKWPTAKFLIFTALDDHQSIAKAFQAGANGYLLHDSEPAELIFAVFQVANGHFYLSPCLLPKVIESLCQPDIPVNSTIHDSNLSVREKEMLRLIASGNKNKNIAQMLCLSVKTVESHRYNLMKKLDAHNAAELTTIAVRMGML